MTPPGLYLVQMRDPQAWARADALGRVEVSIVDVEDLVLVSRAPAAVTNVPPADIFKRHITINADTQWHAWSAFGWSLLLIYGPE